jgi:hypothetical protein
MFIIKDKNDIQLFKVHKLSKDLLKTNLNNIKVSKSMNKYMDIYKKNLNKTLYNNFNK